MWFWGSIYFPFFGVSYGGYTRTSLEYCHGSYGCRVSHTFPSFFDSWYDLRMAGFHFISWLCYSFSVFAVLRTGEIILISPLFSPPIQSYIFVMENDGVVEMGTGLWEPHWEECLCSCGRFFGSHRSAVGLHSHFHVTLQRHGCIPAVFTDIWCWKVDCLDLE